MEARFGRRTAHFCKPLGRGRVRGKPLPRNWGMGLDNSGFTRFEAQGLGGLGGSNKALE